MSRHRTRKIGERYDLLRSPFAQNPTQRDVASLVREKLSDLRTLATPRFKEQFLVRREIETRGKQRVWASVRDGRRIKLSCEEPGKRRGLVYPEGRLRAVHERFRYHLSKIIQPSYLMSPRKGRAQRDNAIEHLNKAQYLTLDLRQFYPSTTRAMIRNSLMQQFKMAADVAGLIAHLATADEQACFGSPLTPVLASLVHRQMFDQIADLCAADDLSYSVWVDDLTISGEKITGQLKASIREVVASAGLRSHKLRMLTGNKPVFITGVGVVGSNLIVPKHTELRSMELWQALKDAQVIDEVESSSSRLLSHLGGIRAVVGANSVRGQKVANEMNSIRQKRDKSRRLSAAREIIAPKETILFPAGDELSAPLSLPF